MERWSSNVHSFAFIRRHCSLNLYDDSASSLREPSQCLKLYKEDFTWFAKWFTLQVTILIILNQFESFLLGHVVSRRKYHEISLEETDILWYFAETNEHEIDNNIQNQNLWVLRLDFELLLAFYLSSQLATQALIGIQILLIASLHASYVGQSNCLPEVLRHAGASLPTLIISRRNQQVVVMVSFGVALRSQWFLRFVSWSSLQANVCRMFLVFSFASMFVSCRDEVGQTKIPRFADCWRA